MPQQSKPLYIPKHYQYNEYKEDDDYEDEKQWNASDKYAGWIRNELPITNSFRTRLDPNNRNMYKDIQFETKLDATTVGPHMVGLEDDRGEFFETDTDAPWAEQQAEYERDKWVEANDIQEHEIDY